MEAQEQIIRTGMLRSDEGIEEMLKEYIRLAKEAIDRERSMDGNDVQALKERCLAFVNEIHAHLELPALCPLCPELYAMIDLNGTPCPKLQAFGMMELRCGHRLHTQCYVNKLVKVDMTPMTSQCYMCDTSVLEEPALTYFRGLEQGNQNGSAVNLWETNPEFRTELKALCKERASCIKLTKNIYAEMLQYKKEFTEQISISVKTIVMFKKEYQKKMNAIKSRRSMIYYHARYSKRLNDFCKKYNIWSSRMRGLRHIRGGPRLPANMQIPWRFRRSIQRMLRVKLNSY
jgi:hypothetical protein